MSNTATIEPASDSADHELIPISVESLKSASNLDFDLFIQRRGDVYPRLFRARDIPLKTSDLNQLVASGTETLFIRASSAAAYRDHLRDFVMGDSAIPLAKRYAILSQAARAVFEEALRARDSQQLVAVSDDLGRQIAALVSSEELLLFDLIEVMLHDYTTYAHATRVCTYASLIAKTIGIYDREALLAIAKGGLLHDVGKVFIASPIVSKDYRLTPKERECMREHPAQGFLRLASRSDLEWGTLMMVYQHHERIDGCGYPVGLHGPEIHEWARICAVANTHDALVRDDPVIDDASLRKLLRNLELQVDRCLDREITQCWIETLKTRPSSA